MSKARVPTATNSSTRHVFEAMRTMARSDVPLGLNEIANELDLPASTAHRALMTLEESGYVRRVRQSARFEPGATLHHLIRSMVAQFPVRAATAGPLSKLSSELDVTTSLNWRLGWSSIRLASFEGIQESFQLRRIGELRPLHDGIGPAAILLALSQSEREQFRQSGFASPGSAITSERIETFARQLENQGFLELPPSDKLGLYWISMPVRRYDVHVGGSSSVGFSMHQRTGAGLATDIDRVRTSMANLQSTLDEDPTSTTSYFDGLSPDAFGALSSPSRSKVSI